MQQGPRVAVIGLDCGTPQLLFGDLAAEVPEHRQADVRGDVRRPREHHAADHGPRLGVRDDGQDARRARDLRLPQPQGHELRGSLDRPLGIDRRARRLGHAGCAGQVVAVDRRAARVPAPQGVPRLARRLLPDAAVGGALRLSAGARGGDRGGARREGRVHLRHPPLPPAGDGVRPRPGLQDDRAPVQGGASARPREAVGLLHDGGDGHGPAPSRVLAPLRPEAPALPGGQPVRGRLPAVLPRARRRGRFAARGPSR